MTRKLFYENQFQKAFSAKVLEKLEHEGQPAVVLDQTCFYATSGGQPHDTGTLNGVLVVNVFEDQNRIIHVLKSELQGTDVKGEIHWERRLDHMQQHHGQHMLSESFIRVASAETMSFHLGDSHCTIDLSRNNVSEQEIQEAQSLANTVVFENREVIIGVCRQEELKTMPLRKPPPADVPRVRIVYIKDFDCSPCSGTHPDRTGLVGSIAVLDYERQKNCTRVYFVCGKRTSRELYYHAKITRDACSRLSCTKDELGESIARHQAEIGDLRKQVFELEKITIKSTARSFIEKSKKADETFLVTEVLEKKEPRYLKLLANEILNQGKGVVFLLSTCADTPFVLARSESLAFDIKAVTQNLFSQYGGKGGGPPNFVQGILKAADHNAILQSFREHMK